MLIDAKHSVFMYPNPNIRRLSFEHGVSVAWIIDALSLLPPDAMVTGLFHDVCRNGSIFYVVSPEFSAVDRNCEIPELKVVTEQFTSFFGQAMLRPAGLIDPMTNREFKREN